MSSFESWSVHTNEKNTFMPDEKMIISSVFEWFLDPVLRDDHTIINWPYSISSYGSKDFFSDNSIKA